MTNRSRSVSFDRAAGYYDRTRSLPGAVQSRVIGMLAAELREQGPVLEIGAGTGRISLPLHEAGIPLVGLDLSRPMLTQLMEKAGGPLFPLVQADATRLPFADHVFGAAFAVHVLHLIPEWQRVIGELVRVIRPGGVFLNDQGSAAGRRWAAAIAQRFQREAGIERRFVGVMKAEEVDRAMADHGAVLRLLPPIRAWAMSRPEDGIAQFEAGEFSWTWGLDERTRRRAAEATRAWASERFGPLDRARRSGWTIQWRAYELSG